MKYKKYPKYKDSGIEWLGEIPEHWEVRKLGQIGKFSASGIDKKIKSNESKVKIINFVDVINNEKRILNKDREYMVVTAPKEKIEKHLVKKGDLIFMPSSETAEEIGYAALVDEDLENTSYSYHVLRFRFNIEMYHSFKKYLTNNKFVLSQFSKRAKGTIRQTLSRDDFKSVLVVLPPLSEQKAIATFLDREIEKIDTLIKKEEELIKLLEEKKEALITKVVTKGLKNTKMKDSGIEWLGEIPEHWEVRRLKYLGEIIIGLTYSPKDIVDENEGILVLRASNLKNGKIVFDDNVFVKTEIPQKLFTKKDDILICTRSGSKDLIGKNALIDEKSEGLSFGAFLSVFRNTYKNTDIKFIFYVFNSQLIKYNLGRFMTTTINQLTSGMLKDLSIPLPPFQEQKQIAEYLDKKLSQIDKLIEKSKRAIELLKEKKESLITNAVTGKIDVRNCNEA